MVFTALINACVAAGRREDAMDVYNAMVAGGFEPNLYTYTTLLKYAKRIFGLPPLCRKLRPAHSRV